MSNAIRGHDRDVSGRGLFDGIAERTGCTAASSTWATTAAAPAPTASPIEEFSGQPRHQSLAFEENCALAPLAPP
jgi:hypothetical protein